MGVPLMSITRRPVVIGAASTGAQPGKPHRIAATARHLVFVIARSYGCPPRLAARRSQNRHDPGLRDPHQPNNAVPHGEAYALSHRAVALIDHAMDAGGGRRTLRHPPAELAQGRYPHS